MPAKTIHPIGDQSGGVINAVSDDEILDAYRALASKEGIF